MFGYVYKSKETAMFLLITFIIMRCVIFGVLTQPIKLSVDIFSKPVLKKIL